MDTETNRARVIRFCNGAPRTWEEIVSMLAGCTAMRGSELPEEDQDRVTAASILLGTMREEGLMTRECESDPRLDLYCPVK